VRGLDRLVGQVKEILWRLVGNGSELRVAGFRSSLEVVIGSHEKMEGKQSSHGLSGASAGIIDAHQVVRPLDSQIVKLRV
jgi:hypothetical protein